MKAKTRIIAFLVAICWFIQLGLADIRSYGLEQRADSNAPGNAAGDQYTLGQSGSDPQEEFIEEEEEDEEEPDKEQEPEEAENTDGAPKENTDGAAAGTGQKRQPAGADTGNKVTVKSVRILYQNGTEIDEDDKVSTEEKVMIRYDFSVAESVAAGDTVVFSLPEEVRIDAAQGVGPIPVPLTDASGNPTGDVIAYVELRENPQELSITFTDVIDGLDEVDQAFFAFAGEFDGDKLGQGGKKTIVFDAGGESIEVRLTFEEMVLEIDKELEDQYQRDGEYYLVWRITANPQEVHLYGLTLTDTLPQGLALVSYQFTGYSADTLPDGWSMNSSGGTVEFFHKEMTADMVTVLLTTKVTDLSAFLTGQGSFFIENEAEANATDGKGSPLEPETAEAAATITTEWMEKEGAVSKNNAYVIDWTVTINTDELSLRGVELVDTIPKGLELDEDSIRIQSRDGSKTLTPGSQVPYTSTVEEGGATYRFQFGDIDTCYVATYSTRITEAIAENDEKIYTNSAYFTWSLDGLGSHQTPHVQEAVKAANDMLSKSGAGYFPKRQQLQWRIIVNGSKNPIKDKVTITDELNIDGQKQTYLDGSIEVRIAAGGGSPVVVDTGFTFADHGDGTFSVVFDAGVLDEKTAYITVGTSLDDLDFLAQNGASNRYYYNKATMVVGEDGEPIWVTGEQFITTRVLEKKLVDYDRESREFIWELSVNPNFLTGLGTVTVTDTLPPSTYFIEAQVFEGNLVTGQQVDTMEQGGEFAAELYQCAPDSEAGTVTFTFDEGSLDRKAAIIRLRTGIDDEFFTKNHSLTTFVNTADITMSNVKNKPDPVKANGYASSTVVEKGGLFDSGEQVIVWEVLVNGNGLNWDMDGATLTDKLQDGLALDVDTVELEQYEVEAGGGLLPYKSIPLDKNKAVNYDPVTNEFVFVFPSVDQGYAYKLRFATDVLESGDYDNQITFRGVASIEEDSNTSIVADLSESSAGAVANRKARISLDKADAADSGLLLPGAVFELRDESGTVLETRMTDEDGHISFAYWLRYDTPYALYEVQPPEGYALLTAPIPVRMEKEKPETLRYHAVNSRIEGEVGIVKTSPDGKPLAEVEFTLYDAQGSPVKLEGVTNPAKTGADGKVAFTGLPAGAYSLVETGAGDHIVLDDTPITFTVEAGARQHTFTVINQLREQPGTGDSGEKEKPTSPGGGVTRPGGSGSGKPTGSGGRDDDRGQNSADQNSNNGASAQDPDVESEEGSMGIHFNPSTGGIASAQRLLP